MLRKVWNSISNIGIRGEVSFLERRRIVFLNRVCFAAVVLLSPMTIPAINPSTWIDTIFSLSVMLLLLVISSFGKFQLARYLFIILNTGGVFAASMRTEYFQGEYLYFPLIISVTPLIIDYQKKINIIMSLLIVFGFYAVFEWGVDPDNFGSNTDESIRLFRLNFLYLMIGCVVIGYLYFNLTTRQQHKLEDANAQLFKNQEDLIKAKEVAEANAQAKMHFLSVMSHEIRTPLNAIIGLSNLVKNEDVPEQLKENVDLIHFSSNNLFSIVNDILDWSKIDSGKMELERISMDIYKLVSSLSSSTRLLCEKKNIVFNTQIDPELPRWVKSDVTRLTQILNNLLHNAVKFTREGEVSLIVEYETIKENWGRISFEVKDTGIGMTEEQQEKIFDVFQQADSDITRRFGGSGLGLAISKNLVNLMDSELRVHSEAGKGSTFNFDLDLEITEERENADEIDSSEVLKGKRILIVDDNQVNLVVAENFMKRWGVEYESVLSGQEAIDRIAEKAFDLILMDLSMPEMDGYEATEEIRRRGHVSIPIIALTASALIKNRGKVFASGMNDFESKPFKPVSLYNKLVRHLR